MKLWTDRFKTNISFHEARRRHIQNKWNEYRGRPASDKGLLGECVGRPLNKRG